VLLWILLKFKKFGTLRYFLKVEKVRCGHGTFELEKL